MSASERVMSALVDRLIARGVDHPLRVGIDGVCGSGKSTLARQLVGVIAERGLPAVHLDSDGFHHLREIRYRQGRDSARGYYDDAYDFDALADRVLRPPGPGGSRVYAAKVHDMATDQVVDDAVATAPSNAIVVFDCAFLQRGSPRDLWDEVIYVDVQRALALDRGGARDAPALGGVEVARDAYEHRYMAACDIYLREERPADRAGVVVNHDVVRALRVVRGLEAPGGA